MRGPAHEERTPENEQDRADAMPSFQERDEAFLVLFEDQVTHPAELQADMREAGIL